MRDTFLPEGAPKEIYFSCGALPRDKQCQTAYILQRHSVFCTAMFGPLPVEESYHRAITRRSSQNRAVPSAEEANTGIHVVGLYDAQDNRQRLGESYTRNLRKSPF